MENHGNAAFDPIAALARRPGAGVLAVIIGLEGPSYRALGALMAILPDGRRVGSLSSGCIEADLTLHAKQVMATGETMRVKYGRGSPFVDIKLPCGGGLEVLLLPAPDATTLRDLVRAHDARQPVTLAISLETGETTAQEHTEQKPGETGYSGGRFLVHLQPELFFYIFGKGPEASTFTTLVTGAGFRAILLSPDRETLEIGGLAQSGIRAETLAETLAETRHLTRAAFPADLDPDPWSAVVLFFHDHEWEPPILRAALDSPAFYIGAQGSQRTRDNRLAELRAGGVAETALKRLKGPIGLIPSVRDSRMLAVSVLAEILAAQG